MHSPLDPKDTRPFYVQIMDEIRRGLVRGTLKPGDALPSVRQLASSLQVNPRTVMQAYAELETEGIVETRRGQGTFLTRAAAPTQRDRARLARQVARHALDEAWKSGLVLDDLITALKEIRREVGFTDRVEAGR